MSTLIAHLRKFNRKERLAVMLHAFGIGSEMVTLGESFRENLQKSLGDVRIPSSVFLAMDYHLDWIHVALERTSNSKISLKKPFKSPCLRINRSQQDIDLLVAFNSTVNEKVLTNLVLIEAKAYTGWNNKQLRLKVARLREIFGGGNSCKYPNVRHWFVLMSPEESTGIKFKNWSKWMKDKDQPRWLSYGLDDREIIIRCTEDGKPSKEGEYLVINPVIKSARNLN